MSDLQSRRDTSVPTPGRLFLVFRIGEQRFALDTHEVVEVLPRLPLKPIAHTPRWVAGVLAHRGALVPVIDVGDLGFGTPAPLRTSTRLVLVHYRGQAQAEPQLLGLILQHASTVRSKVIWKNDRMPMVTITSCTSDRMAPTANFHWKRKAR